MLLASSVDTWLMRTMCRPPVFRRLAKAVYHLQPRLAQLLGAHPHHLLQHRLLVMQQAVRQLGVEQVAHPHQQFNAVKGFTDEIARAQGQGLEQVIAVVLGGQDDDRRQQLIVDRLQLRHHLMAIEMRHVDVERDVVGARFPVTVTHLARVQQQHQQQVALAGQQLVHAAT